MSTNGVMLPPGPSLPITVQTLLMAFRQDEFMAWALRRYGDPFTIHMPQGRTMIMFSNPRATKQIFSASPDDLHAGESTGAVLEPFVGSNSLLLLDGARHLRERRMMMPSFHGERMAPYVRVMADATRREMATWPLHEPFAMRPHTQAITLDVIMRAIFGVDDEAGVERLRQSLHVLLTASVNPQLLLPIFRQRVGGLSPWAASSNCARISTPPSSRRSTGAGRIPTSRTDVPKHGTRVVLERRLPGPTPAPRAQTPTAA